MNKWRSLGMSALLYGRSQISKQPVLMETKVEIWCSWRVKYLVELLKFPKKRLGSISSNDGRECTILFILIRVSRLGAMGYPER